MKYLSALVLALCLCLDAQAGSFFFRRPVVVRQQVVVRQPVVVREQIVVRERVAGPVFHRPAIVVAPRFIIR